MTAYNDDPQRDGSEEVEARLAARMLDSLPMAEPPSALSARILADFDRVQARRAWLDRFLAQLWPGAPMWKPTAAFALSLVIGLAAGTLVPAAGGEDPSYQQVLAKDFAANQDDWGEY